ncbi:MAG: DUF2269 family protein [Rhizobacter sp.]
MSGYLAVKWLHILSSTLLFGTGIGSAFYLLVTTWSKDVRAIASVARTVVWADTLFTATTAIVQPVSGFLMVHLAGYPIGTRWIAWSMALYVIAIACWLPVVWIQVRLRDLAREAVRSDTALPPAYWRWFRWWLVLGVPAFFAFVAIFWLMTVKPA